MFRLDTDQIAELVQTLCDRLVEKGRAINITIVGGAAISLGSNPDRSGTVDIDVFTNQRDELAAVADEIATEQGLPGSWLNADAQMFMSPVADHAEAVLIFESGGVRVSRLDDKSLLAMKLVSGRPSKDFEDIRVLVRSVGVSSIVEAEAVLDWYWGGEQEMKPTARAFLATLFGDGSTPTQDGMTAA